MDKTQLKHSIKDRVVSFARAFPMSSIFSFITFPFVDNFCTLNYSSCESSIWVGDGKIWSENKVFRADNAI